MVTVRSQADAQADYAASGGRASQKYARKIATVTNWQSQATSAESESNYAAGVQDAVASGRRAKALSSVSNAEWQSRAVTKGAGALASGIGQSAIKWGKGAAPYLSALASVTLPPKTTDGMANLTQRAGAIVAAMEAQKKAIKG